MGGNGGVHYYDPPGPGDERCHTAGCGHRRGDHKKKGFGACRDANWESKKCVCANCGDRHTQSIRHPCPCTEFARKPLEDL